MKKIIPFLLLAFTLFSCEEKDPAIAASPHIKKCWFNYHKKAPGIEGIFFTCDSVALTITNEDSVAYNANLSKLLPQFRYTGKPNKLWINGNEWNEKDSIDFTQPVELTVQSYNGKGKATYTITIKKHKVNPNEIHWQQLNSITTTANVKASKAIQLKKEYYLFAELVDNTQKIYQSSNGNTWTEIATDADADIAIRSITPSLQHIYALAADGQSVWMFNTELKKWERIQPFREGTLLDIVGAFKNQVLLSIKKSNGQMTLLHMNEDTYKIEPHAITETLPTLFPERGAAKVVLSNALHLLGGELNHEVLSTVVSTENGHYWTNLLDQPEKFSYPARTDAAATLYEDILLLFGGHDNEGNIMDQLYFSENYGYSWEKATKDMILPESYVPKTGLSVLQIDKYIYLIGGQSTTGSNEIEIWQGQLRKTDFIRR